MWWEYHAVGMAFFNRNDRVDWKRDEATFMAVMEEKLLEAQKDLKFEKDLPSSRKVTLKIKPDKQWKGID